MRRLVRRLLGRDELQPGDRVVYAPDGSRATVNVSQGGWAHVYWDDEPPGESGGSRVRTRDLRRERGRVRS